MVKECNKNRADVLGDRMKRYEAQTTGTTLMPNTPVYARIDGRAFHTLTRGLQKPFDPVFNSIMHTICYKLVEETGAILGYVQSDEISLGWENFSKAPFEGKLFKLESVLSSMATAAFYQGVMAFCQKSSMNSMADELDDKSVKLLFDKVNSGLVSFDCRIFNLPSMEELANAFIWRENDAVRNSISSLAQANFSHKQLQGKSSSDMINMLMTEKGINWEDLPSILKRGMYLQKENYTEYIPDEIWEKIPEKKRPEDRNCTRSRVVERDFPIMRKIVNKVDTYFYNKSPLMLDKATEAVLY